MSDKYSNTSNSTLRVCHCTQEGRFSDRWKADESDTRVSRFHYIEALAFPAAFARLQKLCSIFGQFRLQQTQMVFGGFLFSVSYQHLRLSYVYNLLLDFIYLCFSGFDWFHFRFRLFVPIYPCWLTVTLYFTLNDKNFPFKIYFSLFYNKKRVLFAFYLLY